MKIAKWSLSFFLFLGVIFTLDCFTNVTQAIFAQASTASEAIPTGISPLSKRTSLLDVPVSVYPLNKPGTIPKIQFQELNEIKILLEDRTPDRKGLDADDFLPMTKSALTSGFALFRESGSQSGFNYAADSQSSDTPVNLREDPTVEVDANTGNILITFRPELGGQATALGLYYDMFADFYVVAQTSLNLLHGDRFEVSIPKDGIIVTEKNNSSKQYTLYPTRFPGSEFKDLNPSFAEIALFQGDVVQINNMISETDNSNRIDVSSEAKTVLGLDVVGKSDQEYFVKEVRVNFFGTSLQALAPLMKSWMMAGYTGGYGNTPSFMFSPWFYNYPTDLSDMPLTYASLDENGEPVAGNPIVLEDKDKPNLSMTMPLTNYGTPNETFMFGMDDPNSHVTGYVSFGPRQIYADYMQSPRAVNQDIFQAIETNNAGGVFMYRDLGGVKGQYDPGVDHVLRLDSSKFRVEALSISPAEIQSSTSPYRKLLSRLMPAIPGSYTSGLLPFLFGDTNLLTDLFGISPKMLPKVTADPRPPLGSLECYDDPDCSFLDTVINLDRSFQGINEGQLRYLSMAEANGRTNAEDLFGTGSQMIYGFSVVLPVSKDNSISDLIIPSGRTGKDAGGDIFVAVRTSEKLRNLDSIIPFIQPKEIVVGNYASKFTKGATEGVSSIPSVTSVGLDRKNTQLTSPLIGRPRPRVKYHDLTQPTESNPSNNNILYDNSMGSPAKPVIGLDVMDYGQNATLLENYGGISTDILDNFLTENTVLAEMVIEFLPSAQGTFDPAIFSVIPTELGIDILSRIFSTHSVALYVDDDTPVGDGMDNDGDGLYDEEIYNLQDDDGDGLIDEDLGDGDPAGVNGVYDQTDNFLPYYQDAFGDVDAFPKAMFVGAPNNVAKYQAYFDLILPETNRPTLTSGALMPLTANGTWFAELDFRVLNFSYYRKSRMAIFPYQKPFNSSPAPDYGNPRYNMGMYPGLDPKSQLLDIVANIRRGGGDFKKFPYLPDDLAIEDPNSGENVWMIVLAGGEGLIGQIADPDGDGNRSFALSMVNALRIPSPLLAFNRVGSVPMVIQVPPLGAAGEGGGTETQDPQGR